MINYRRSVNKIFDHILILLLRHNIWSPSSSHLLGEIQNRCAENVESLKMLTNHRILLSIDKKSSKISTKRVLDQRL